MKKPTAPNSINFSLTGFDHVGLVVASVDQSRKFYVDQLGFEELSRPAFDFHGAWFRIGQTKIHVIESNADSGQAGWGAQSAERISRGHHIAYRTSNFEQTLLAIEHYEVEIAIAPKVRPDGANQVYIYDPDRHLIEICS